ncbi:BZ3500_MvSof-1268-A1-R1_Chr1-1g00952 [Microbotryum saponariae]|uniref:BZ3500_MvSof-1268-A1-R1_Chr1-1g00952 protein n=1 Tax=Microbotryum saponariae TaxID=289078 RepID=A0A2X0KEB9_9BASI|nr:BZ3500_MvSof-1268-A1-R1_Chr1-1g00952 [Microbotryum saponariae]SCZ93015.1 BZ3501_MvSof-1269-A2-R1_Chr1-1g00549 [Microbotryum saponariae]
MCGIAFALSYRSVKNAETRSVLSGASQAELVLHRSCTTPTAPLSDHDSDNQVKNGHAVRDGNGTSVPVPSLDSRGEVESEVEDHSAAWWRAVTEAVQPRGPDASAGYQVKLEAIKESLTTIDMRFHTSVLHMRGDVVAPQPFVEADTGDVLLWNGEVFDGLTVGPHDNDGSRLFHEIQQAGPRALPAVLQGIEGPYAFFYFDKARNTLWFGRDHLGRRSLLLHRPTPSMPHLILASCAPLVEPNSEFGEWEEVACDALFSFDLNEVLQSGTPTFVPTPRSFRSDAQAPKDSLFYPYDRLLTIVPTPDQVFDPPSHETQPVPLELQSAILALEAALELSIRQRILNLPPHPDPSSPSPQTRIAVLFSGGLDCTTLACLVDRVSDEEEGIDLINVAFENPRSIQSMARTKEREGSGKKKKKDRRKDGEELKVEEGGVDLGNKEVSIYDVPDRLTGKASWKELRRLRPKRRWNFVGELCVFTEVDVPYQEMMEHRSAVMELMRPHCTIMDLSISLAFYFAARGQGHLASSDPKPSSTPPQPYHSSARVLLSGLGADELLGGYARHRKAFYTATGGRPLPTSNPSDGSWSHLIQEMQMDLDRLPIRNLGRDDRIISHHGKEARYPFLAAHVIDLCTKLPIWIKCDPRLGEGKGDKRLLRLVAGKLGLGDAAGLKRAIHFGARTAKMELGSGRDKGEDAVEG